MLIGICDRKRWMDGFKKSSRKISRRVLRNHRLNRGCWYRGGESTRRSLRTRCWLAGLGADDRRLTGNYTHLLTVLSRIEGHAGRLRSHLLLVHDSRGDGGAPVLSVWRIGVMQVIRLKVGWHGTTSCIVHGAELGLGRMAHLRVASGLEVSTSTSTVVGWISSIAHITVCRLTGFATQVLTLGNRVLLRGHGDGSGLKCRELAKLNK